MVRLGRGFSDQERVWQKIDGAVYDRILSTNPLTEEVLRAEQVIAQSLLEKAGSQATLIEIGSGPGNFWEPHQGSCAQIVAIDNSPMMARCAEAAVRQSRTSVFCVHGDAVELRRHLDDIDAGGGRVRSSPKVFAIVTNTLGIMESGIRSRVLREIRLYAQPGDHLLLANFRGERFHDGVRGFYELCPELCGRLRRGDADYATTTLTVRETGYCSHWFSGREMEQLATVAGVNDFQIQHCGIGSILVGLWSAPPTTE